MNTPKKYQWTPFIPAISTTLVEVYATDPLAAEKAIVEKVLEDVRWQLIKHVCATEVYPV